MQALLLLLAAVAVGSEASPMVIDDADFNEGQVAAIAGAKGSCLADAHSGGYKTLPGENSKVGSSFKPQATGCYKVEEYHPGAANQDCAAALPLLVVRVEFCRGRSKDVLIPQHIDGGKWNTIGNFPLFKGETAGIYAIGSKNRTCQDAAADCFGAVDAFRVTRVNSRPCQFSLAMEEAPKVQVLQPRQPKPKDGVLTLGIDVGSSVLSQNEVLLRVRFQWVAIEEALTSALQLDKAEVTALKIVNSRRLSGGLGGKAVSIEAYFKAWGGAGGSTDAHGLQTALKTSINAKGGLGSGLSIVSAAVFIDVQVPSGGGKESGSKGSESSVGLIAGVVAVSVGAVLSGGVLVLILRRRLLWRLSQQSEAVIAKQKGVEYADPVAEPEKNPAKAEAQTEDNDSASTDTPKEDNTMQGNESNEGSNLEV